MITIILFIIFIGKYITASNIIKNNDSWVLVSSDNGINVMERSYITDENEKIKERTGTIILNSSINNVVDLISDVNKTKLWMKNVDDVNIIKIINENEWYEYIILNTPYPLNKQDMVSKYTIKHIGKNRIVIIIENDAKLLPIKKNIDRVDNYSAEWDIEQVDNSIVVTFTTKSTQPPKYPSWIQDKVVRKVFSNNLKNFKQIVSNS